MTVVIPARNEEHDIGRALEALALQLDLTAFDVIVLANNCSDATAERARAAALAHARLRVHIVEHVLPQPAAHVGSARKIVMDCAAERFIAAGKPLGIVATTDADTVVASDWTARTFEEMQRVDAVAGFVDVAQSDQQAMLAPVRRLYARETAFRRVWTDLESIIDPRPEDPPPRHGAFVGASFAVTAALYVAAGGLPAIPCLEDREFMFALRRIDARIRFSLRVRAWTSGRRISRVPGGFGTFIGHLHDVGATGHTLLVENPRHTLHLLEGRAALRRIWQGNETADDVSVVCDNFALDRARYMATIDRSIPFGAAYEKIVALAGAQRVVYPLVPVDEAIAVLRAAAAARMTVGAIRSDSALGVS